MPYLDQCSPAVGNKGSLRGLRGRNPSPAPFSSTVTRPAQWFRHDCTVTGAGARPGYDAEACPLVHRERPGTSIDRAWSVSNEQPVRGAMNAIFHGFAPDSASPRRPLSTEPNLGRWTGACRSTPIGLTITPPTSNVRWGRDAQLDRSARWLKRVNGARVRQACGARGLRRERRTMLHRPAMARRNLSLLA